MIFWKQPWRYLLAMGFLMVPNADPAYPMDASGSPDRVVVRKSAAGTPARKIAFPLLKEQERGFLSPNGQFMAIATYPPGQWKIAAFRLLGQDGRVLWTREEMPYGVFHVSNQGDVVHRIGEWGSKLQFFDKDGKSLGTYENENLVMGRGFDWDDAGTRFVVAAYDGQSSTTVALSPAGAVLFSREHQGFHPSSVKLAGTKILLFGRRDSSNRMLVMDDRGAVEKQKPWANGQVSSVLAMTGGKFLLVAPKSCILVDAGMEEITRYGLTDKDTLFADGIASPKGQSAIIKYRRHGGEDLEGFLILDQKVSLIGRSPLRSKKLAVDFKDETHAVIQADSDGYEVDFK